jgi:hypothetical protein
MRNHFDSEESARQAIKQRLKDVRRYNVIKGKEAKKHKFIFHNFNYYKKGEEVKHTFIKRYYYPKERDTYQKQKTYRTIMRRKARKQKNDT